MDARPPLCRLLLLVALLVCSSIASAPQIQFIVENASSGDNVVVMMDSRKEGVSTCENDRVIRYTGPIDLGNILPPAGCNSEFAVFSENHAMLLKMGSKRSSKLEGPVTVTLQPPIRVPITVWITHKSAEASAHDELNNANLLFRQNKVGIQFDPAYENVWDDKNADRIIHRGINAPDIDDVSCTDAIGELRKTRYYRSGMLNVYYAKPVFTGRSCAIKDVPRDCSCPCAMKRPADGDGNIIYLGRLSNLSTLVHELGHAFGLRPATCEGHVNFKGDDNIMDQGGWQTRNRFTLGQVFRMNTHMDKWGGTMLITNNLRPATDGRECPPNARSALCPSLGLDWDGKILGPSTGEPQATKPDRAQTRWLQCDACEVGVLNALTRHGQFVVPRLIAALNAGPPSSDGEEMGKLLRARFKELDEQARKEPKFAMRSNEKQFLDRYLEGYDTLYRIRTAQALAAIGGIEARQALEAALPKVARDDVRMSVRRSLEAIK